LAGVRVSSQPERRRPTTSAVDFHQVWWDIHVAYQQEQHMSPPGSEVPYGTLDLMVLKTLAALGPLHGYGVARRIEQVAAGGFLLNQGTIYPALLRLEQKGWIASAWGTSENNRRARFYSITARGRKQLAAESELWARTVSMVNRLLEEDS
jgi:transcriptional regulator